MPYGQSQTEFVYVDSCVGVTKQLSPQSTEMGSRKKSGYPAFTVVGNTDVHFLTST